jgi:hypothetical protein
MKEKIQSAPFPPSHNEYNINPAPPGTIKSNLSKLQAVKKVTNLTPFSSKK